MTEGARKRKKEIDRDKVRMIEREEREKGASYTHTHTQRETRRERRRTADNKQSLPEERSSTLRFYDKRRATSEESVVAASTERHYRAER